MNGREFDFLMFMLPWIIGGIAVLGVVGLCDLIFRAVGESIVDAIRYHRGAREIARTRRRAGEIRIGWKRREDFVRRIRREK